MYGRCRMLPRILSQAPRPLPAGAVSINILPWLRLLCQESLVEFRLQSAREFLSPDSIFANVGGLFNHT